MNRFAFHRTAATAAVLTSGTVLLAGCNTVVPTPATIAPGAVAGAVATEPVTIEHSSLRSRISVYESALKACKQRGFDQAIFQAQANQDPQLPPATGRQLSTFACR